MPSLPVLNRYDVLPQDAQGPESDYVVTYGLDSVPSESEAPGDPPQPSDEMQGVTEADPFQATTMEPFAPSSPTTSTRAAPSFSPMKKNPARKREDDGQLTPDEVERAVQAQLLFNKTRAAGSRPLTEADIRGASASPHAEGGDAGARRFDSFALERFINDPVQAFLSGPGGAGFEPVPADSDIEPGRATPRVPGPHGANGLVSYESEAGSVHSPSREPRQHAAGAGQDGGAAAFFAQADLGLGGEDGKAPTDVDMDEEPAGMGQPLASPPPPDPTPRSRGRAYDPQDQEIVASRNGALVAPARPAPKFYAPLSRAPVGRASAILEV